MNHSRGKRWQKNRGGRSHGGVKKVGPLNAKIRGVYNTKREKGDGLHLSWKSKRRLAGEGTLDEDRRKSFLLGIYIFSGTRESLKIAIREEGQRGKSS